jgi:hypothetical protein
MRASLECQGARALKPINLPHWAARRVLAARACGPERPGRGPPVHGYGRSVHGRGRCRQCEGLPPLASAAGTQVAEGPNRIGAWRGRGGARWRSVREPGAVSPAVTQSLFSSGIPQE